ncbi:unnamed protein product [Adineta ricciae]|nr:unnamed protein product [Adineta ricciae]
MATGQNRRIILEIERLRGSVKWTEPSVGEFHFDYTSLDDKPTEKPVITRGRILTSAEIFKEAAFEIEIKLLDNYPFKPPEIRFLKKIYHPNVGTDGRICDQLLYNNGEHKPTTSLLDTIKRIAYAIDNPELDHAVNPEIAAEYQLNRAEFNRKALEWVKLYGLSRN